MEKNSEFSWVDYKLAQLDLSNDWQPDVIRALECFDQRRAAASTRRRKWTLAAAITVTAGIVLFTFPAPRAVAERIWVPCVNACSSLFLTKTTVRPAAIAPDFALKDATGATLRLSDYKGKVVLLNFWATWCTPCQAEIPWFIEFERTYRSQGFAVVGVSLDEDKWEAVKPYMESKKINYRITVGDSELAQKYGGVEALPETFLIDRDGGIVAHHVGIVSRSEYEKEIARTLGKN